ncbi:transcription intermediary factor 1-alpha isoform X2 [Clupea harengus]|uniref:RING-type E3 ubiquitin transferase n=1 Tax=Clupea harengus TaxID=7950 RepID=A0A8M1KKF2_CLUHA|nr:transcription intermediary factor 1-alpha isoform X2 [Clupea harengus]
MDESAEKVEPDDIVIIVENEAESMPVQEESEKAQSTHSLMDCCPICKLNFHSREPKLLPCLHSFCKKCLPPPSRNFLYTSQMMANHQLQEDPSKPLNVIRCPVCHQECMEVEVLENFFVKDSMEVPSSTVEKTSQLCMSCEDNTEATGYCVECVEFLCVTCIEAHQRVKFTRDHTIRQKEEMSPEGVGVSTQKPVFCDVHKQEPLKLFCETCDRLTCRDCQLSKHKDHNYQFLDDAYRNHREHLENMTRQLQDKRKAIEEVSNAINNGLHQVDENRKAVTTEIKKSICNLIMEINRKGKILVNQLEALTKDHESALKKQQEDVTSLSKHLDHVISFTKWATAINSGTALLYCKRLILCQIQYLMRAKCSASYVPQSTVRFQCRSSFWASNVDLGSLVMEKIPGHQPGGMQMFPNHPSHPNHPGHPGHPNHPSHPSHPNHPGPRPEGPAGVFPGGPAQQRQSTLAQLQMQVEKLAQHPSRHPPPNHWSWYHNMRLPGVPPPRPMQGGSPSQVPPNMAQQGRRYGAPQPNTRSPTTMLQNAGFPPQTLRGMISSPSSSNFPPKPMDVLQGASRYAQNAPPSGGGHLTTQPSLHQRNVMDLVHLNRRPEPPGPMSLSMQRPGFPHTAPSTATDRNAQSHQSSPMLTANSGSEGKTGTVSWKRSEPQQNGPSTSSAKRRRRSSPGPIIVIKDEPEDDDEVRFVQSSVKASLPDSTGVQSQTPRQESPPGEEQPTEKPDERTPEPDEDPNEDWCAVCQNGGELLCCDKCPKVFHLSCHIPALKSSPSGEWFCSFCRDLTAPEMVYDTGDSQKTVKEEPDSEGLTPVDKRKCERLLLRLYCNELSTDFQDPASPSTMPEYNEIIKTPMDLSVVRTKLDVKQNPSYKRPDDFVADIRLIFKNCAKFHKEDNEMASVGVNLENFFEEQLKGLYPEQPFPGVKEEGAASSAPEEERPSDVCEEHGAPVEAETVESPSPKSPSPPSLPSDEVSEPPTEVRQDEPQDADVQEDSAKDAEVQEDSLKEADAQEDSAKDPDVQEDSAKAADVQEDSHMDAEGQEDSHMDAEVQEDSPKDADVQEDSHMDAEGQEDSPKDADAQEDSPKEAEGQEDSAKDADVQEDSAMDADVQEDSAMDADVQEDSAKDPDVQEDSPKDPEGQEDSAKDPDVQEDSAKDPDVQEDSAKEADVQEDSAKEAELQEDSPKDAEVQEKSPKDADVQKDLPKEAEETRPKRMKR